MDSECFHIDELEVLSRLGSDDPRLDHLRDCPQCRSLLATYRAFVEPIDLPRGADLGDARSRLTAFLNREVVGVDGIAIDTTGPAREDNEGGFLSFLAGLLQRPLRPALALAAIAVLVVGVSRVVDFDRSGNQEIVLRGGGDEFGKATLALSAPEFLEDGRVRLSWNAMSDADGYRVIFFAVDLTECARVDAGIATELVIDPNKHPCLARNEGPVFYRVVVLRQGEPAMQSSPRTLPLK